MFAIPNSPRALLLASLCGCELVVYTLATRTRNVHVHARELTTVHWMKRALSLSLSVY